MYLPKVYEKFKKQHPDIFESYEKLGVACRAAGPLDKKTQNLVKLGIAVGANSRGSVMSHTRKALDAGASQDEIVQAVLLALTTIGFPSMIAAMEWVESVWE